jgi:hypothetical protein
MATIWNKLTKIKPTDQADVWVKVTFWYGEPVKAIWDENSQTFVTSETDLIFPAWVISRWKNQ